VFSAWIKGIDAKASNPVWGEKLPFGTVCGEFSGNGWVHGVAFSPSGNTIAWVCMSFWIFPGISENLNQSDIRYSPRFDIGSGFGTFASPVHSNQLSTFCVASLHFRDPNHCCRT
jgi:hypothetical protein